MQSNKTRQLHCKWHESFVSHTSVASSKDQPVDDQMEVVSKHPYTKVSDDEAFAWSRCACVYERVKGVRVYTRKCVQCEYDDERAGMFHLGHYLHIKCDRTHVSLMGSA